MSRFSCCVLAFALLATVADAQFPGPVVGALEFSADGGASLVATPDGTGPAPGASFAQGGGTVDASIRVRIVDLHGDPIAGYPREYVWLQFDDAAGTAASCEDGSGIPAGAFLADADTDANGWTNWTRPLRGGGWSEGPATIYIDWFPAHYDSWLPVGPLPLRLNSPDIDGDGRVNLTDVVFHIQDLHGAYDYRSDYNWDGTINLSDVVRIVTHLGSTCP